MSSLSSLSDEFFLDGLNIDWDFIESMLRELPSNIFFKDTKCRYLFATHYWNHLKRDDSPDWSIRGKTDLEIRKDKENALRAYQEDLKILKTGVGCQYTIEICLDGVSNYYEIIKNPVRNKENKIIGIIGLINIVTDRVKLQKELEAYAQTDTMTGLYNRRYLEYWCEHELKEHLLPISVISADCDGLKQTNDVYGHFAGDEMIRMSAHLFKTTLPQDAVMFRMGGDEFLLILPHTDAFQVQSHISSLKNSHESLHIRNIPLHISYGTATMTSLGSSILDVIAESDKRMYDEKEGKRKMT